MYKASGVNPGAFLTFFTLEDHKLTPNKLAPNKLTN